MCFWTVRVVWQMRPISEHITLKMFGAREPHRMMRCGLRDTFWYVLPHSYLKIPSCNLKIRSMRDSHSFLGISAQTSRCSITSSLYLCVQILMNSVLRAIIPIEWIKATISSITGNEEGESAYRNKWYSLHWAKSYEDYMGTEMGQTASSKTYACGLKAHQISPNNLDMETLKQWRSSCGIVSHVRRIILVPESGIQGVGWSRTVGPASDSDVNEQRDKVDEEDERENIDDGRDTVNIVGEMSFRTRVLKTRTKGTRTLSFLFKFWCVKGSRTLTTAET